MVTIKSLIASSVMLVASVSAGAIEKRAVGHGTGTVSLYHLRVKKTPGSFMRPVLLPKRQPSAYTCAYLVYILTSCHRVPAVNTDPTLTTLSR